MSKIFLSKTNQPYSTLISLHSAPTSLYMSTKKKWKTNQFSLRGTMTKTDKSTGQAVNKLPRVSDTALLTVEGLGGDGDGIGQTEGCWGEVLNSIQFSYPTSKWVYCDTVDSVKKNMLRSSAKWRSHPMRCHVKPASPAFERGLALPKMIWSRRSFGASHLLQRNMWRCWCQSMSLSKTSVHVDSDSEECSTNSITYITSMDNYLLTNYILQFSWCKWDWLVRWHQNSNVNVCQWTSLDVGMQIGTVYRLFFANGVSLYLNNLEVFPIRFCQMKCISAFCRSLCILCPLFGDNHTAFSGNQAHIPTSETTIAQFALSARGTLERTSCDERLLWDTTSDRSPPFRSHRNQVTNRWTGGNKRVKSQDSWRKTTKNKSNSQLE